MEPDDVTAKTKLKFVKHFTWRAAQAAGYGVTSHQRSNETMNFDPNRNSRIFTSSNPPGGNSIGPRASISPSTTKMPTS